MAGFHIPGGSIMYARNVSNAANTLNCPVGVDTIIPLTGDGNNNFNTRNAEIDGRVTFDDAYNSGKGGIILNRIHHDSYIECRLTYVYLGSSNAEAVFKVRLVSNLADPNSGVIISNQPVVIKTDKEQTSFLSFYGGDIDAIYPLVEPDSTSDFQINGFLISVLETR